jgi:glycosyltransferase involved in cell wall biosynthesis
VDSPYVPYFLRTQLQWKTCSWLEEAVIREADAVVFITQQMADRVMRKYPVTWKDKVHVIPHGYNIDVLKMLLVPPRISKRLRLVYTGTFYPGNRTPEGFLRALKLLGQTSSLDNQIEVVLIGSNVKMYQPMAERLGLGKVIEFHGEVSFLESLELAAGADVLLVIDAPSSTPSVFLPSKLIDYLIFKKPILGLSPLDGASANLLRRLGCKVVDPDDESAIAGALTELLQLWQSCRLKVSPIFDQVAREYDIRETTRTLDKVLRKYSN